MRNSTRLVRRTAPLAPAIGALLWTVPLACGGAPELGLSEPRVLSAPTSVGAAPMFAVSPKGTQAVAWVSAPNGGSDGRLYVRTADTLSELRDELGPIEPHGEAPPKIAFSGDGSLYALYVVGKEVPGRRFPAGALRFARSADGGRSWGAPVTVTDDSTFGSHNFHALHVARDGVVYVAWLDGRHGKSAAFVTRSADGGRTWEPNRRVATGEACPCCRTAIATAPDGTVYVAWRAVLPGNVRDIVLARSSDGGATWNEPARVHADDWVFDGCPHAGPSLQVGDDGRLHIAWWTGKEGAAGVFYARSQDGGKTFGEPVPLGMADLSRPAHVQLALGARDVVAASWDDGTRQLPDIALRLSRDGGRSFAPAQRLSAPGRVAGYPVLAIAGDELMVAWSEQSAVASHHEGSSGADVKDGAAVMKLSRVGDSQVMMRSARLALP
ncbi:MAG: exo-alpha-sialidase [Gemmatimonadaceae bacterium]